jgi:hypothetical protein
MRRRRLLLGVGAACLALLLGVAGLWWFLADEITPANAARIRPGMSLRAVNELLGKQGRSVDEALPGAAGENHYVWEGSLGAIHVAFRGDLSATDGVTFRGADSLRARLRRLLPGDER